MNDDTLPPPHEKLIRKRIAEIPLLQAVEQRLGLTAILSRYIKPHGTTLNPPSNVCVPWRVYSNSLA